MSHPNPSRVFSDRKCLGEGIQVGVLLISCPPDTNFVHREREELSWEFKLKGAPWDGQGSPSRSLLVRCFGQMQHVAIPRPYAQCAVLAHLYRVGWLLVSAMDNVS